MQETSAKQQNLHDRIFQWVIACLKFLRSLPRDSISVVIIQQLAKACTSVGANDQEAVTSSSDKDFISKYQIVKKELSESIYWFKVIREMYPQTHPEPLLDEATELLKIVSSIILKVKRRSV